jgi:hypothetical protein
MGANPRRVIQSGRGNPNAIGQEVPTRKVSGLATMTSAAKCEMGCELQKLVSHHFLERNRHPGDELGYE